MATMDFNLNYYKTKATRKELETAIRDCAETDTQLKLLTIWENRFEYPLMASKPKKPRPKRT
jgi:hypothetical protein